MWTHPLPPPDSGASFSSFGVFVFEIWVLRFRSRVLRFRDLEVFVFDRGCFVFEFWVLRFRDLGASCFGLRFRVLRFRNYHRTIQVGFLCRFGLKTGIDFAHFGLESVMALKGTKGVYQCI